MPPAYRCGYSPVISSGFVVITSATNRQYGTGFGIGMQCLVQRYQQSVFLSETMAAHAEIELKPMERVRSSLYPI